MSKTKLTDRQKKKIIADYIDNNNYRETARMNGGISPNTVKALVNNNEKVAKKCAQKKEENTQDMLQYLESKNEDKKRIVDLCFQALNNKLAKPDMFTNVKDIITVYGIIIDKEFKFKELQSNKGNINGLSKVEELLNRIEGEANDTNR